MVRNGPRGMRGFLSGNIDMEVKSRLRGFSFWVYGCRYMAVGVAVLNLLLGFATAGAVVVSRIILFSTVCCDLGRQFITCFMALRLPRQQKRQYYIQKLLLVLPF